MAVSFGNENVHMAILLVVLHRIIAQVEHHFIQHL